MKRAIFLAFLLICLPLACWANSSTIVFQNSGGVIQSGNGGTTLSLLNSTLTSFAAFGGTPITGNLGTVSFTTGALVSGTLGGDAVFAAGGSFTIMGNGSNGLPNGVLFQGTFSGPVNWTVKFNPNGFGGLGNYTYTLTSTVTGKLKNGLVVSGTLVELTFDVPKGEIFSNKVNLNYGVATVTVPEPGTLGLLGTGLLGLAGLIRRKFKPKV